jgi:hypothetical protein
MWPSLRHGDVLHVDPALRERLRPGDVVCYESEASVLRIHRLVAARPDALLVRGDALGHGEWVSRGDLLGVVDALERRGRRRRVRGGAVRRRLSLFLAPLLAPLVDRVLRVRASCRREC